MKKFKIENQILIMLAVFSISMGLWENFRQLWLQDNGFSPTNIGNIISIGTLVSVLGIFFAGKYIKLKKLKTFITCSLVLKFMNLIILFCINNIQNSLIINICIVIDVLTGYVITTSIYPLITTIIKNNAIYSKRKLTEYLFKDVGVFIGGILIGRNLMGLVINYNICLMISIVFLAIAIMIILNMNARKIVEEEKQQSSILKQIFKNKLQRIYMIYTFVGATAFSTALGLKMLTFTNYFNFTDANATNYLLIIGLISDVIGIIALKFLTPKNDYITITIKFGLRFFAYTIAFFSNNTMISLIAVTWSLLISTAYENISDGYYINAVSNELQFRYTNFRYIVKYLGEAVGIFLCGIMYEIGLRYMLGLSAIFMLFQITLAYYLIYIRKKSDVQNENRMKIYIVRHGQVPHNMKNQYNTTDEDLTDIGIKQAEELRAKIRDMEFDIIISSPLIRAKHTAEIITDNKKIVFDNRIIERNCGDFSGQPLEATNRQEYWNYYTTMEQGNSENIQEFFKRIYGFLDDLKTKDYKSVLVVAHSGVSKAFSGYFEGIQDGKFLDRGLKNCEIKEYYL